MKSFRLLAALLAACALTAANASGQPAKKGPKKSAATGVVMSGLHNPRGLAIDRKGTLYVAEAGQGGSGPCAVLSDGLLRCFGSTGRVSRLRHGDQEVVADGLPSNAPAGGGAAVGPHDLTLQGGKAYVTVGIGANPLDPAAAPFRARGMGRLAKVRPSARHPDHWRLRTDIAAFEAARNPDAGPPDSNPYGIFGRHGRLYVTDAGGNDLLKLQGRHVSLVAVLPSRPQGRSTDSVPTTVARGPDGAFYVGELTGGPFLPNQSRVWKVVPGQAPVPFGPTWSWIIDLAWGPDGHLYVLEFGLPVPPFSPGALWRLESNGTKTPIATGLESPGGFVFGHRRTIYISNKSTNPVAGEVLRIRP
jgi:hypothetical protein